MNIITYMIMHAHIANNLVPCHVGLATNHTEIARYCHIRALVLSDFSNIKSTSKTLHRGAHVMLMVKYFFVLHVNLNAWLQVLVFVTCTHTQSLAKELSFVTVKHIRLLSTCSQN